MTFKQPPQERAYNGPSYVFQGWDLFPVLGYANYWMRNEKELGDFQKEERFAFDTGKVVLGIYHVIATAVAAGVYWKCLEGVLK